MSQRMDRYMGQIVTLDEISEPSRDRVRVDRRTERGGEKPVVILPPIAHLQAPLHLPDLVILQHLHS